MTNILEGRLTRSMREDMAENRATTATATTTQDTDAYWPPPMNTNEMIDAYEELFRCYAGYRTKALDAIVALTRIQQRLARGRNAGQDLEAAALDAERMAREFIASTEWTPKP